MENGWEVEWLLVGVRTNDSDQLRTKHTITSQNHKTNTPFEYPPILQSLIPQFITHHGPNWTGVSLSSLSCHPCDPNYELELQENIAAAQSSRCQYYIGNI